MPKITFLRENNKQTTIDTPENWSIMRTAIDNDIYEIEGLCNGCLGCATCHITIHPDWVARVEAEDNEQCEEELDMLDTATDIKPTSRLGCQIKLTNALDGLIVALPGVKTDW